MMSWCWTVFEKSLVAADRDSFYTLVVRASCVVIVTGLIIEVPPSFQEDAS